MNSTPQHKNNSVLMQQKSETSKFSRKEAKKDAAKKTAQNAKPIECSSKSAELLKCDKISRIRETETVPKHETLFEDDYETSVPKRALNCGEAITAPPPPPFAGNLAAPEDKNLSLTNTENREEAIDDVYRQSEKKTNSTTVPPSGGGSSSGSGSSSSVSPQLPCTISADRFLCMDIKSSSMTKRSAAADINAVKLLEQNTIDLKRNNIHLKNSLKVLTRKYNLLCETVRQVKSELSSISLNEDSQETPTNQFRNIKISCENIMKILNNVNTLLQ